MKNRTKNLNDSPVNTKVKMEENEKTANPAWAARIAGVWWLLFILLGPVTYKHTARKYMSRKLAVEGKLNARPYSV